MKKPFALLAAALIAGTALAQQQSSAPAQTNRTATGKGMASSTKPQLMAEELGLTQAQVADLDRADEAHAARMRELHQGDLSPEAKRARATELRKEHDAAVKALLSEQQWSQWQQARQAARDKAYGRMQERREQKPHQE